jgi:predicted DNA-binding transcriptional regulator AlpA
MEALIDTKAAAELLGLREPTIRKYTMLRLLPHRKIGTRVVFAPSELEKWANERRIPTLAEESKQPKRRQPARVSA